MVEASPAAQYLAEFLGTFLLVFTVGCNVLTGSPIWGVTSISCVLMASIYALGDVSGANFNPAVSLALGLTHNLPWAKVGIYSALQIVAGVTAGFAYTSLLDQQFELAPAAGFGWWEAGLAEIFYTCMLCFVVLNCACSKKNGAGAPVGDRNQFYGLAIGFVIIAGGYGAGHISGAAFNPAVALGIALPTKGLFWGTLYVIFEFLGSALAVALFRVCRPDEFGSASPDYELSPTRLAAEFIGTFYLALTVGLNVLGESPAPVFSIAAALMCMIYSLGNCSGGHFNPAVTLAILLAGRGSIGGGAKEAGAYVCAQVLGGIVAANTYSLMEHGKYFPLEPGQGFGWVSVGIAEFVYTFLLCLVVLSVATLQDKQKNLSHYYGLAIASCVTAGGYAIGAVSGGSLNPAVSIGISTPHIHFNGAFWKCLVYASFECCGAVAAAGVFKVTRPSEYAAKAT